MKSFILIFALALFIFASCDVEDDSPKPTPVNQVDFSNLKAGQMSSYVRYQSDCEAPEDHFSFTGDTLVLAVVEHDGKMKFRESLTANSSMFLDGRFQEPIYSTVKQENDYILIPDHENSALFFFYANDTIFLNPTYDVILEQAGCVLLKGGTQFIGNEIGFVESFEFGEVKEEDRTVISCEPFFDLDAYLLHDENKLYVSHVLTIDSVWTPTVLGWHLMK